MSLRDYMSDRVLRRMCVALICPSRLWTSAREIAAFSFAHVTRMACERRAAHDCYLEPYANICAVVEFVVRKVWLDSASFVMLPRDGIRL